MELVDKETLVSFFQNCVNPKPVKEVLFSDFLEDIRIGKYQKENKHYVHLLQEKGKDHADTKKYKKTKLPAITYTGTFSARGNDKILSLSRYMIIDIDDWEDVPALKRLLSVNRYIYAMFTSPSRNGIKVVFRADFGREQQGYKDLYLQIAAYMKKEYNIPLKDERKKNAVKGKPGIDISCSDLARLCLISYDPEIFINPDATFFEPSNKNNIMKNIEDDIQYIIEQIETNRTDMTDSYDDWLRIGFALNHALGENGRDYYHRLSCFSPKYEYGDCNNQYDHIVKSDRQGITGKTFFSIAKYHGLDISCNNNAIANEFDVFSETQEEKPKKQITSNKFMLTEEYLNERYIIRYNVVSNKFEYREKEEKEYKDLNENNLYVKLQKDNINISLNNLIALLKSDFVIEYHPFREYFESLPRWDGETDYIINLCGYVKATDKERFNLHFKKWIVRAVKTAIDNNYYNKQAFVFVSNKQNSGKSTFCRFLCPVALSSYIVENIGIDKDSLVSITENFLINLDELSTAGKNEINSFKSMFSKDKIKARLTYDKRASVHARRASFLGSTDRWEFLTDENGSVRWLCFDIEYINWNYSKEVSMDKVYAQAFFLLNTDFVYELTSDEIKENDKINKKYQVSTPERDLIQRFFESSDVHHGIFKTATEILEYISIRTTIKLAPTSIGKELKFLCFERKSKRIDNNMSIYGYYVKILKNG